MRPHRRASARLAPLWLWLAWLSPLAALAAPQPSEPPRVVVLPFEVRGAVAVGHLETTLPDLLRARLEADERIVVPGRRAVSETLVRLAPDAAARARAVGQALQADLVVSGSVTELAGRFSLDVRLTPARAGGQSIVYTAASEEELLDRVNELAAAIAERLLGRPDTNVLAVRFEGLPAGAAEAPRGLRTRVGEPYDPGLTRLDLDDLRALPGVASATVGTERTSEGIIVTFHLVAAAGAAGPLPPELVRPPPPPDAPRVAEVRVRGNRRIEADAVRARISTQPGDAYDAERLAADIREIYALGFFRNIRVFAEESLDGRILTFEVEENPVVRQVSISGNESVDGEEIRDALTLTTGSTLDLPLLHENRARIEALYRAQGFYLAEVGYEIETLAAGAVAIHFEVEENGKLRLRTIRFEGNEHFDDDELRRGFKTKPWRLWSYVTRFLDNSGTYSEPVFSQDLRAVEQKYMDAGFLRVEISDPEVQAVDDGLEVVVEIQEGQRFNVGSIDVRGDETVDLEALRAKLRLAEGEIFNRSALTQDVEVLTAHYTGRGFYFASVNPRTEVSEAEQRVDVVFEVEKGPLYFIRNIEVAGNTQTVDPVIRREMRLVEGQLYSARAIQLSRARVQSLGFFEQVEFEPRPTDEAGLLDLDLSVVERPTGSFSFGAGFSSQDQFVVTGSLSQTNLFGRGYGVQLSADIGGNSNRFFLSFADPYLLGSTFSLSSTLFQTEVDFEDFEQRQSGLDLTVGHSFNEANTGRGFLRYSFSQREVEQDSGVNAASIIFREILNGKQSTSLLGLSARLDTRDDRIAPSRGTRLFGSLELAGLGGFARFARLEGSASFYKRTPEWLPFVSDRSTFLFGVRGGWTLPLNDASDFDVPDNPFTGPVILSGVDTLDQIDDDLELPLTERYFLGGLGTFQLRGYKGRSAGPRRAVLRRSGVFGDGPLFFPVGTRLDTTSVQVGDETVLIVRAVCEDDGSSGINNQGDGDGDCNSLGDEDEDDFDDLDETDVIGGNRFLAFTFEYRFPISEELGLTGIVFLDMGDAFAENESLFDVATWRYGTGVGVQWFSPFGPLEAFWGVPLRKLSVEDAQVFEFSVGGQNF